MAGRFWTRLTRLTRLTPPAGASGWYCIAVWSTMNPSPLAKVKFMSRFQCLFMMTVFSLSTVAADGQDWCRWRGPAGNSISTETGWSASALVPAPKIRWVAEVGLGYSAVSVQGNRLYTMGHEDGKDTVFCLSAKDGRELWHYTYPCKPGSYAGPRATPVCDDAQVYTMSRRACCFALNRQRERSGGKRIYATRPMA